MAKPNAVRIVRILRRCAREEGRPQLRDAADLIETATANVVELGDATVELHAALEKARARDRAFSAARSATPSTPPTRQAVRRRP